MTTASGSTPDVAVIGAGSFGAWTAWHLQKAGRSVLLVDQYGPGNSRSSSGDESRVMRMGYGPDEIYTRFARRSLTQWKELFAAVGEPSLFQRTGVLWMTREGETRPEQTLATLARLGIAHERLSRADLERRYPQIAVDPRGFAVFEPESGAILARRAVQAVARDAVRAGAETRIASVLPPEGGGRLRELRTTDGSAIRAGAFVFACGAWLGQVLPDVLGGRLFPTRQETFFLGAPRGDERYGPDAMPCWIDFGQAWYGIPDIEGRGFKVGTDAHGPALDPDSDERVVSAAGLAQMRAFVAERFPALKKAPVVETRVCQYENTSNGDLVIDLCPGFDNVWIAGGGSGHGFKHGPAVGEHVAEGMAKGDATHERFRLSTKEAVQRRTVY